MLEVYYPFVKKMCLEAYEAKKEQQKHFVKLWK